MKTLFIYYCGIFAIAMSLTACGGGGGGSPSAMEETSSTTDLSVMVDAMIAENLENGDRDSWDLNNFIVNDDIEGDAVAEQVIQDKILAMMQAQIDAELANPDL